MCFISVGSPSRAGAVRRLSLAVIIADKNIFASVSGTNVNKDKNKNITNNNNKQVVLPIKIKNSRIVSTLSISNDSNKVYNPSTNHSTDDYYQFPKTKDKRYHLLYPNTLTFS